MYRYYNPCRVGTHRWRRYRLGLRVCETCSRWTH